MKEFKKQLREQQLVIRRALSQEQVQAASDACTQLATTLPCIREASTLATYVASKDNEVDTRPLIEWAWSMNKTVLVPIAAPARQLLWSHLSDWTELKEGRFGILEPPPETRHLVDPPSDTVLIIPGLAFTPDGRRLGYGGGYYDVFLAAHPGKRVALAFDQLIVDSLPREDHDMIMDYVVTDTRIITCGNG